MICGLFQIQPSKQYTLLRLGCVLWTNTSLRLTTACICSPCNTSPPPSRWPYVIGNTVFPSLTSSLPPKPSGSACPLKKMIDFCSTDHPTFSCRWGQSQELFIRYCLCVKLLRVEIVGFLYFITCSSFKKLFFLWLNFLWILIKNWNNCSIAKKCFIYRVLILNFTVCHNNCETFQGEILDCNLIVI